MVLGLLFLIRKLSRSGSSHHVCHEAPRPSDGPPGFGKMAGIKPEVIQDVEGRVMTRRRGFHGELAVLLLAVFGSRTDDAQVHLELQRDRRGWLGPRQAFVTLFPCKKKSKSLLESARSRWLKLRSSSLQEMTGSNIKPVSSPPIRQFKCT